MLNWQSNLIALAHFAIALLVLLGYSMLAPQVEETVPQHLAPAVVIIFGITAWAGCTCAYAYGVKAGKQESATGS